MTSDTIHKAVMTGEAMDALKPHPGGIYIDATLGGGTHTAELLERSGPEGRVMSLDVDPVALARARERSKEYGGRWKIVESNFRDIAKVAKENGFGQADGVLIDLGLSSDELVDPAKGLSFQVPGPLDMRLGPRANESGLTAAEIVNSWRQEEIEKILREFGEEKMARKIAEAIVRFRKTQRIVTTIDLSELISSTVPRYYDRGRIHPATRTFQALRIAVNDELGALQSALDGATSVLKYGGVLCVISFHSLEDRIAKNFIRANNELEALTKKPQAPSAQEIKENPRSRSAKLRAAKKVKDGEPKNTNKYVKLIRNIDDQTA
ncbi:16S rRNA (cytosine(1402)-N(4))-methyltransferase RsmH [Candidatus Uhrbacteria bacterium]|nr:16S rRNA (cytosine(1402)-N(4))-methyltransferase RsmH [Candidatus Uhrbacteria bacterium]